MATFTIGLSGSSVVNGSKSWTISDADVQSLIDYLIALRTQRTIGSVPPTAQQALSAWTQEFVDKTKRDVQDYKRSKADVAPITFT